MISLSDFSMMAWSTHAGQKIVREMFSGFSNFVPILYLKTVGAHESDASLAWKMVGMSW
jgi:hypothetical protein